MPKNFLSKDSGVPYFLTFTVIEWLNVFTRSEYMRILWDSLQYCRQEKGMKLYGFVFMMNHMHVIVSANEKAKLRKIIRDFKKFIAQKIIQVMQKRENRKWLLDIMRQTERRNKANIQYQFWVQDDGEAKEIYSDEFFVQKMEYVHHNPVRAEIVMEPEHYRWSSARFYKDDDFRFIDRIV